MRDKFLDPDIIFNVELRMTALKLGIRYSKVSLSTAHSLVVRLDAGDISGWGEVFCPVPDLMWPWALQRAAVLPGKSSTHLDDLLFPEPSGRPELPPESCSTYFHPDVDAVAEAFSIALHDLESRRRGIPFRHLLGTPARTRIHGMPVIGLNNADTMVDAAVAWSECGMQYIKIKLSGILKDDIHIVEKIRKHVPDSTDLQVDANGAYQRLDEAQPLIEVLNKNRINVIEDLFDIGDLDVCQQARSLLQGLYMVDKDAHWPSVRQVLDARAADLINQHPHNQGCMRYALRIAQTAFEKGIQTAIGSSGVVGIQSAAFQQLASLIGLTRPCEDISLMPYYEGPVRKHFSFDVPPTVLQEPIRITDGCFELSDAPGLGISVCSETLDRLTLTREIFSL